MAMLVKANGLLAWHSGRHRRQRTSSAFRAESCSRGADRQGQRLRSSILEVSRFSCFECVRHQRSSCHGLPRWLLRWRVGCSQHRWVSGLVKVQPFHGLGGWSGVKICGY